MNKNPKRSTKHAVKRLTKADQPNLKDLLLDLRVTSAHLFFPDEEYNATAR
jgi:hypothetical protein